jgi:hypothetical protein
MSARNLRNRIGKLFSITKLREFRENKWKFVNGEANNLESVPGAKDELSVDDVTIQRHQVDRPHQVIPAT